MHPSASGQPAGHGLSRVSVRLTTRTIATILTGISLAACGEGGEPRMSSAEIFPLASFRRLTPERSPQLKVLDAFDAEENDAVINVAPSLVPDPRGGLLVVDGSESQVRRYDEQGRLLWHAGRRGHGPGELSNVTAVGRMAGTGEVVAAERGGRLTFFDSTGASVVRTVETRLTQVEEMVVVDDGTLLLSGVGDGGMTGPRLHLWSTTRDTVLRSFFSPFPAQRNTAVATIAGFVRAAVNHRDGTIAAIFGASDTVYTFTRDGRPLRRHALPSPDFRRAPARAPGRTITDPLERARWISSFDLMADVEWLPDGSLLLAYQSIDAGRAMTRRWHLLRMSAGGENTFEMRDAALLLGVNQRNGRIYLVDEAAEAPNQWTVAELAPAPR
jgi:hypothetical protein